MNKLPKKYFHLCFSVIMGAMMVFIVTFATTFANGGMTPDFFPHWLRNFAVAYLVAVPAIYFLAPRARKLATRFADDPMAPGASKPQ